MAFQLSWTIEGEQQLSRVLLGLQTQLTDLRKPFQQSADFLVRTFSTDVFDTKGGAIQERWQRLSPYTVAQKARHGFPPDILIRTGTMKRSFQSVVSSDQAVISNPTTYFKYHQSNQPRSKLPRRVMMKLGDQQKEQIIKYFQAFLRDTVRK